MTRTEKLNQLIGDIAHFMKLRDMKLKSINSEEGRLFPELRKKYNERADHYQRCAQRLVDRYNRISKKELTLNSIDNGIN